MIKVLYGGYLRPFKHVGHHPQFEHIHYPPPGYEFVTGGHFGLRTPARLLKSISSLSWNAVANGSTLSECPNISITLSDKTTRIAALVSSFESTGCWYYFSTLSRSPLTYRSSSVALLFHRLFHGLGSKTDSQEADNKPAMIIEQIAIAFFPTIGAPLARLHRFDGE